MAKATPVTAGEPGTPAPGAEVLMPTAAEASAKAKFDVEGIEALKAEAGEAFHSVQGNAVRSDY